VKRFDFVEKIKEERVRERERERERWLAIYYILTWWNVLPGEDNGLSFKKLIIGSNSRPGKYTTSWDNNKGRYFVASSIYICYTYKSRKNTYVHKQRQNWKGFRGSQKEDKNQS